MCQITSPQAGAKFKTTDTITVSVIDGPDDTATYALASSIGVGAAGAGALSGPDLSPPSSDFSTPVGPISPPGPYAITVSGPGNRKDSVNVEIIAG